MNTIGWLLLLAGGFLIRAVAKGRSITDLPGDIGDAFTAAVSGNGAALQEVLGRSGSGLDAVAPIATPGLTASPTVGGGNLLAEAEKLGKAAKGYKWAATGPDYYDCSGLVYRALTNLKLYHGPRFNTATFAISGSSITKHVDVPIVGDIVLWPGHHMGIVSGPSMFYSALSVKSGIKEASIGPIVGTPIYYRLNTSLTPELGDPGQGLGFVK